MSSLDKHVVSLLVTVSILIFLFESIWIPEPSREGWFARARGIGFVACRAIGEVSTEALDRLVDVQVFVRSDARYNAVAEAVNL